MISKKEHEAAFWRVMRRLALIGCGMFGMAAAFYLAFGLLPGSAGLAACGLACGWFGLGD